MDGTAQEALVGHAPGSVGRFWGGSIRPPDAIIFQAILGVHFVSSCDSLH
jgi:hypothetical protein